MRKKLWIVPVISAMLLTVCLTGCDKDPTPTVPDDTNISTTTPDNTNPSVDTTNPDNANASISNNIVMSDSFVWDKDYQQFNATDITIDKNWDSYITVGGIQISTTQMTDFSALNNYFYNENPLGVVDDMKMAYELNWRDFHVKAETIAPNELANGEIIISASSYPSEDKVLDMYNHNLVISSVQYNSYAAEFDEIFNALQEIQVTGNNVWGIGSSYEDIVAIMGEPILEYTDDVFEHSVLTTMVYEKENCSISITCFTNTSESKGVAIGLLWTPTDINNQLNAQEGYEEFYSGLYSELNIGSMLDEDSNITDNTDDGDAIEDESDADTTA